MALVLSRKKNEEVVICTDTGEEIIVGVFEVRGDKVRLGFTANPKISIRRRELDNAIKRSEREAIELGSEHTPLKHQKAN